MTHAEKLLTPGAGCASIHANQRRSGYMQYPERADRVDLECDVDLEVDSVTFPSEGLNLSATGIALATPARFRKGQPVWVGFDSDYQQCRLLLYGRIVRCEPHEYTNLWGIRFLGLDDTLRDKLQEQIQFEQSIFRHPPPKLPGSRPPE
jgi:hypothetical protein